MVNHSACNFKKSRSNVAAFFCATAFFALFPLLLIGCTQKQSAPIVLSGSTMGTYYKVTLGVDESLTSLGVSQAQLEEIIEALLDEINQSMSTYIADSELSQFNRASKGHCQKIGDHFNSVLNRSIEINRLSAGAFNPLVGPLVERWDFGANSAGHDFIFPSEQEISELLTLIDMSGISYHAETQTLCKLRESVALDFSAVAKGYGVDYLVKRIMDLGVSSLLVDIGGELRAVGFKSNKDNVTFRVAVEKPLKGLGPVEIQDVVALKDEAIATSGDYRNFFVHEGQFYSHTINPNTGYPVKDKLSAVSVIASDCMTADAWATALMSSGFAKAKRLVERYSLQVVLLSVQLPKVIEGERQKSVVENVEMWQSPAYRARASL